MPGAVHCIDACPPSARGVTHLPVRPNNRFGSLGVAVSAHTVRFVARYPAAGSVPNTLRMFRREIITTPPFPQNGWSAPFLKGIDLQTVYN
jgi:hypothetical protein